MRFQRGQGHLNGVPGRYGRKERGLGLTGGKGGSGRRAVTWNECTAAALLPISLSECTHLSSDALRSRECTNNEYVDYKAKPNRVIKLMSRDTPLTSTCTPSASVEAMPNTHWGSEVGRTAQRA